MDGRRACFARSIGREREVSSTEAHMVLIWALSRHLNEAIIASSQTAGLESTAVLGGGRFPLPCFLSLPVPPTLGSQSGHRHGPNLSPLCSKLYRQLTGRDEYLESRPSPCSTGCLLTCPLLTAVIPQSPTSEVSPGISLLSFP